MWAQGSMQDLALEPPLPTGSSLPQVLAPLRCVCLTPLWSFIWIYMSAQVFRLLKGAPQVVLKRAHNYLEIHQQVEQKITDFANRCAPAATRTWEPRLSRASELPEPGCRAARFRAVLSSRCLRQTRSGSRHQNHALQRPVVLGRPPAEATVPLAWRWPTALAARTRLAPSGISWGCCRCLTLHATTPPTPSSSAKTWASEVGHRRLGLTER